MELAWVELHDFRSYPHCRLEPSEGVNVLVGPNGAGKTNFLEGVAFLSALGSFRRVPDRVLVREGRAAAVIRAAVTSQGASTELGVELPTEGRRRVLVNGKPVRAAGDLAEHLNVVVFFPDDLDIVKRGPEGRRAFLDDCGVQLWSGTRADLREYQRALQQRNALLRRSAGRSDPRSLEVWDERLSQAAGRVMNRRQKTMQRLAGHLSGTYRAIAGDPARVEIEYRSNWRAEGAVDPPDLEQQLRAALMASRRRDGERGMTTVGPHRDDPVLLLDGREARTHLSQGEQRTLALTLRLATHQAIVEQAGDQPILLLDDVFSELDLDRAEALAAVLPPAQTFVTTTREEEVPLTGKRFHVAPGAIG